MLVTAGDSAADPVPVVIEIPRGLVAVGGDDQANPARGQNAIIDLDRVSGEQRGRRERGAGQQHTRRGDAVQHMYAKDRFPTEQVYVPAPSPELRLITCGGTFDAATGSYLSNVVIHATQIR